MHPKAYCLLGLKTELLRRCLAPSRKSRVRVKKHKSPLPYGRVAQSRALVAVLPRRWNTRSALYLAKATHMPLARVSLLPSTRPHADTRWSVRLGWWRPLPPSAEVDAAKYEALKRSVATPKSKPASGKKAKAKAAPATTQTKVAFITVFGEPLGFGAFVVALLVLAFVIMAALKYTKDKDAGGARASPLAVLKVSNSGV